MPRSPNPVPQYFDGANKLLPGFQMFYFEAGTSTPKATYSDEAETTPNTHPVIGDAEARLPNVFFTGTVKQVLKDASGVQIWERDNVGSTVVTGDFNEWNEVINYLTIGDIVKYGGKYYQSIQTPNQNRQPDTNPDYWSEFVFVNVWNPNVNYNEGDIAKTSTGNMWKSVQGPNVNNDPEADDGTNWNISTASQWTNKANDFQVLPNRKYQVDGSSNTVDGTLPTSLEVGDVIIVHNESISTNEVKLLNTALTIKGPFDEVTSSDNLVIGEGETAHLVAKTTTILEVV